MSLLEIKGLTKTYGKKETEVVALNNININIEKGEFVAIIGKSGSGKSTLLHLLGGVDKPTSGEIIVDGDSIYKKNKKQLAEYRRKKVGLIYQFYNLIPVLNVYENVELPALLDDRKPDRETILKLLKILDLEERKDHLPNELSGGQQQRVSIARALINRPAIILADEPTGNLDSKSGEEILKILDYFNTKLGQTIILVTHDMEIAKKAKRIIVIKDGSVIQDEVTQ